MAPAGEPAAGPPVGDDAGRAAALLRQGRLVAFPTETVYGLGAVVTDPRALVALHYAVKGRPVDHPVIVHLADAGDLDRWAAEVSDAARRLAAAFWPGPLTLVLPRSAAVPDAVTGGRPGVGLRVPAPPLARALLAAVGTGVAAPSANRFGRVSPTQAADVVADLGPDVAYVLDGGPCAVGVESTIVELTGDQPVLLRPGAIDADQLDAVLGRAVARRPHGPARAPGMLAAHYAPGRVVLTTPEELDAVVAAWWRPGVVVGVLGPDGLHRPAAGGGPGDRLVAGDVVVLEPAGDPASYARVLYRRLRQADAAGVDVLVVVPPPDEGIGAAVLDRLRRAAASG